MKNADMPIMPVPDNLEGYYKDPKTCKIFMPFMGITKREYFAGLAMQGLLGEDVNHGYNAKTVAKWSVEQADALLEELEKSK